jgi:large subunit ribosomal protein L15
MQLHSLPASKNPPKATKRRGRGSGTGQGGTSGRGHKGQKARSGGGVRPGFEGGQMPLYRRMPKRGFNNKRFRTEYNIVNVEKLNAFTEGETVNQDALLKKRILAKQLKGLRILGDGELKVRLVVEANGFTGSAREKIEKLNGICKVIG